MVNGYLDTLYYVKHKIGFEKTWNIFYYFYVDSNQFDSKGMTSVAGNNL